MAGLRSRPEFELILLRRKKSTHEVAEEILPQVSTWWQRFVMPVQGREVSSTDNEILLPQAQATSFGNWVKRGSVFQDLPTDQKIYVCLLQFPNMLTDLCAKFLFVIFEWVSMVGESCFAGVLCKTDVSLRWFVVICCDRCLVDYGRSEAIKGRRILCKTFLLKIYSQHGNFFNAF